MKQTIMLPKLNDQTLWKSRSWLAEQWHSPTQQTPFITIHNPATQEPLCALPQLNENDIHVAIDHAHQSFLAWQKTDAFERANLLKKLSQLLLIHQEDLATIITLEQGKPITEARGEIVYSANFFEWFAEEAKRSSGAVMPSYSTHHRLLTIKQAVGVCAAITPWNFPLAMIARKLAPALAAGCTMLIKPAPQTPFSALALAELMQRAGFPAGVVAVLIGDAQMIGNILTQHPTVRKISFTGSTHVGKQLLQASSQTVKRVSMELGGNAPFIIFDDVDIAQAVKGLIAAKFRNAGQTCVCANRIFVHNAIYKQFCEQLTTHVQQLVIGNGLNTQTQIGPLINQAALTKVEHHLQEALQLGAQLHCGGKRLSEFGPYFFAPTVLSNVSPQMAIAREETFGPIAPLIPFDTEQDVIQLANDSEFGLAAYVYTNQLNRALRISEALEYGMVGINTGMISSVNTPFGGIKQSGLGREGGTQGIDEYLNLKYINIGNL